MKRFLSLSLALILAFSVCITASAKAKGDVNNDGKVNSSDALEVLKYSVGMVNRIDRSADLNGDGKINSSDALTILQISVGIVNGTEDAIYKASFSLSAKVGSKNYSSSDVIPVKAGETVSVTLSLKNNYYTGPTSAQLYYNKNIFSGAPSAQFNTEGRLYQSAGRTYCTFKDWDALSSGVKKDCWPNYSESKLTQFKNEHKFLRITMAPNASFASEVEKNINENLITIHFVVSKSAAKGATGQIIIPIESRRTKDFLNGHLMCAVHESEDITSDSSVYVDGLAYDCSKAVLNFKVS